MLTLLFAFALGMLASLVYSTGWYLWMRGQPRKLWHVIVWLLSPITVPVGLVIILLIYGRAK